MGLPTSSTKNAAVQFDLEVDSVLGSNRCTVPPTSSCRFQALPVYRFGKRNACFLAPLHRYTDISNSQTCFSRTAEAEHAQKILSTDSSKRFIQIRDIFGSKILLSVHSQQSKLFQIGDKSRNAKRPLKVPVTDDLLMSESR